MNWLPGVAVSVIVAGLVATGVLTVAYRFARRSHAATTFISRSRGAVVVFAVAAGLNLASEGNALPRGDQSVLRHITSLALVVAVAWVLVNFAVVLEEVALQRYDIGTANNLLARKKRTQIVVLHRVATTAIVVLAVAAALTTFSQARALGTSLLASAGIAGLIAGAAARPTVGNLFAGIQIALSEPIRLDDVVVVEGQWGRVEEITLAYVVVRLWDSRRLVVPISYFVENSFENWTRSTADILGTVFLYLDFDVPMMELRRAFMDILSASPLWDGRVGAMQMTDVSDRTVEIRALVSAADASTAFDLRCEVRERLIAWLATHHPEALPRWRSESPVPMFG